MEIFLGQTNVLEYVEQRIPFNNFIWTASAFRLINSPSSIPREPASEK